MKQVDMSSGKRGEARGTRLSFRECVARASACLNSLVLCFSSLLAYATSTSAIIMKLMKIHLT